MGDGSVFDPMPAEGDSPEDVWRQPDRVKAAYAQSIAYSLDALTSFVQQLHNRNLVLVVLGDHQPASIVSGNGASHDVPVSIIAADPAVTARVSGLGLAGRAAAGRRRTGLADGHLPGPLPHRLRPLIRWLEAAELLLEEFGQPERGAVLEHWADELHTYRQAFGGQTRGYGGGG